MQAQKLIERLGGINALAHKLMTSTERKQPAVVSRRQQMVRSWARRNSIPPSWLLAHAPAFVLPAQKKLKPCKAPRTRHDWEHYANKTTSRRFADGSVELLRRGIWYCTACKAAKYGEPREQAHVVVA